MRLKSMPLMARATGLLLVGVAAYLLLSGTTANHERGPEYWQDSIRGLELAAHNGPLPACFWAVPAFACGLRWRRIWRLYR